MIINTINNRPLPVYGDGLNIRDWLYVRDHCRAIWTIMKQGKRGETYNIGGGSEMENIRIVELVCDLLDDLLGKKGNRPRRGLITFVKDRPGHDRRYAMDFTKLKNEFGWSPEESFRSGLIKTIQWYLNNKEWTERVISGQYQSWIKEQYG